MEFGSCEKKEGIDEGKATTLNLNLIYSFWPIGSILPPPKYTIKQDKIRISITSQKGLSAGLNLNLGWRVGVGWLAGWLDGFLIVVVLPNTKRNK